MGSTLEPTMAAPQHRTVQAFPANSNAITHIDAAVIRGGRQAQQCLQGFNFH